MKILNAIVVAAFSVAGSMATAATVHDDHINGGGNTYFGGGTVGGGTINWAASTSTDDTQQAVITCSGDCSILFYDAGAYGFSASGGELFGGPSETSPPNGNSLAEEIAWINDITGESYLTSGAVKDETGGSGNFTLDGLYAILKMGNSPSYTIIRNDTAGSIEFSYDASNFDGNGLSHHTIIGQYDVPIPAAGFLLLGGLGGLALMRRRKKA